MSRDYGAAYGESGSAAITDLGSLGSGHPPLVSDLMRGARPTVPEMLTALADINRERGGTYGKNYKYGGEVLRALFQNGEVTLRSPEEFNRFSLIVYMAGKLSRYAWNLSRGGHDDSLDDIAVYAMLAKDCDMAAREGEIK